MSKKKPQEVSSKQPVSVIRQSVAPIRPKAIDPRFDRSFGNFNPEMFKAAYSFVKPIQEKEKQVLEESLKKERDPERKAHIQRVLDRQKSMEKAQEREEFRKNVLKQWKKTELELVKQGKKPFFLKRSDQKKLELIARFKEMKERAAANGQTIKLDKLLEKRHKHKSSKQRTQLPAKPRGQQE